MLAFGALAASLLLYPTFTNAQDLDQNANPPSVPTSVVANLKISTTTASFTVPATLQRLDIPMPTKATPPAATNKIEFVKSDEGYFDKSVLKLIVGKSVLVFAIDTLGPTTYVFSEESCKALDSAIPEKSENGRCEFHPPISVQASRTDPFESWEFSVADVNMNFTIGEIPKFEEFPFVVVKAIKSLDPQKEFFDYFQGVHGVLGLGNGSTLLNALQNTSAPGYSIFMGDNDKVNGSIVFGGYNSGQVSSKNAKVVNEGDLKNLTLSKFGMGHEATSLDSDINVELDPKTPFILLPKSFQESQAKDLEVNGDRLTHSETLPDIDFEFNNGLKIRVAHKHYVNAEMKLVAVKFAEVDKITLGRPFFHAAYFGDQGNGKLLLGPATPSNSGDLQSFDVINREIATGVLDSDSENSATPDDASSPTSKSGSKANVGAIIGGVIGGLAFIAILGLLFFCCRRRRLTRSYSGRKRGMSKEFDEDEMARGINGTDSFGSNVAPPAHQNAYSPVPPPAHNPTELQEVKNNTGVATYDTSPITPGNANLSVGAAPVGAATVASTATTAANSPTNSPLESKRFSAFSGINRKPVPQRASRQADLDSDDDEISVRSPQSDRRAPSPPVDSNRSSFVVREVPRLPFTFNRGSSDAPGL